MYANYLDSIEAYANGIAAQIDGQTYQVRRVTPRTSGSVLDSKPVGSVYAKITRSTSKVLFENQTFDALIYEAEVDWRPLVLGDVLTEVGPQSDGASYVYAQHRITNQAFWARAERSVTIHRPADVATRTALANAIADPNASMGDIVGFDAVAVPGNAESDEATFDVLTLTNGAYSFSPMASNPTAARVPFGLQPTSRAGTPRGENLPTDVPGARMNGYVPPLIGVTLQSTDVLIDTNGGKEYMVIQIYSSDQVGLVGSTMVLASDDG